LVKYQEGASKFLGGGLANVKRYDCRHGAYPQTGYAPTSGDLGKGER
jgi:hypothetical protein